MKIKVLPAFDDNYIFVLMGDDFTAVVDPGDAVPVMECLESRERSLDYILNTHHHSDHIGGNKRLQQKYGCKIIGPKTETTRIPDMDQLVGEADEVALGVGVTARVLDVPGHTTGHIAYYFEGDSALFCGDALFSVGCGRMFEGTAEQFWGSLQKIKSLPDDTAVYCAHEYTLANIDFALTVEQDNMELKEYWCRCYGLRGEGEYTIPCYLGLEKRINPFLLAESAEEFAKLRKAKDNF